MTSNVPSAVKQSSNDTTRIGQHAPHQPLSGVKIVKESIAVSGLGHGAFLRQEEDMPAQKKA